VSRDFAKEVFPRAVKNLIFYVLIVVLLVFFLFPFYWLLTISLKTQAEAFVVPPRFIFLPTISNFVKVWQQTNFFFYLKNSLIICLSSSMIALILGALCAYGISRFYFRGREDLSFWILSVRMFPPIATALPLFLLFSRARLVDTYIGMIWIYVTINLPFSVWMLRGFFEGIPREIEESAMMDGCGYFRTFSLIALPIIRPGLSATLLLNMLFVWNEFLFALIFTSTLVPTLPIRAASYKGAHGLAWAEICTTGVLIVIPLIIFAIIAQRHLIRGLTLGAMKG